MVFECCEHKILCPLDVVLKKERSIECAEVEIGVLGNQSLLEQFVSIEWLAKAHEHLCLSDLGWLNY